MTETFICDPVRTPIGRYGGALSSVRADDLAAIPIAALLERNENLDPVQIEDLAYGCANQAGEDNRNVARMAVLLAGLPVTVPAVTVNRLCGSGMNAIGNIADRIRTGAISLGIAGGVESMSRAPFVLAKQAAAFGRNTELYDTTLGWRFVNRRIEEQYGVDSMAETAENVADGFLVSREDQDAFALRSQHRCEAASRAGVFAVEIVPVTVPQRRGDDVIVDTDEHPRFGSTIEGLAKLRPIVREGGTVTAGNASGINDGAAAVLLMSAEKAKDLGLEPIVKIKAFRSGGLDPAYMVLGPVPAVKKVLAATGMTLDDIDMIELNEAFASQAIGCMRELGIEADRPNELGSGISIGHPIGCTGARQMVSGMNQMKRKGYATGLITMCIGGGMGMAMIVER